MTMRLYRLLTTALIGASSLYATSPAEACRAWRSPHEKLSSSYARGIFSAVAEVTITDAAYTSELIGDSHPWSATATISTMLMGIYGQKTVTINRGGGSSACDNDIADDNSLPKAGDKWVVYFWTSPYRGQIVWIGYPFDVAASADTALGPSMKPNPSIMPGVPFSSGAKANDRFHGAPPIQ